ncbi:MULTISPECIES: anaerobic ribonucleoside-triphosphate reductase [unclassified Microbulbifer]|uniref:anaerobic ribonucleoside-triphosphate reductase n=1 Tax=Microbulbifer TaxID=48073 RepID=UPI0026499944|nr:MULTISPECIES: anaerobic ribonucleoside-triphosphate reductase [unclassified Microbulbifer]MDP5208946.1 anaerobic ribonucleoside-triphosphate reductase [Microbulbifer sp. 2205BS26-8]
MHKQAPVLKEKDRTRCEVWSRVMGYHRPVSFWNPGKQSEHRERRFFVANSKPGSV